MTRPSAASQPCFSNDGEGSFVSASYVHPRLTSTVGSSAFLCMRKAAVTVLRLEPAACLGVNGRGKEDLDPVLLLNQPQHSLGISSFTYEDI